MAVVPGKPGRNGQFLHCFGHGLETSLPLHIDWYAWQFLQRQLLPSVLGTMKRVVIWRARHGSKDFYSKRWEAKEDFSEASLGYRL